MAIIAIKTNELPESIDTKQWMVVADTNGILYKISIDNVKAELGIGALMQYRGSVVPSSAVQPAGDFFVTATQDGTYTNYGGVVVPVNSLAVISRVGGVYTSSITELNTNAVLKTDIAIKADPETNLFPTGIIVNDRLVNSVGSVQVVAGWKVIVIDKGAAVEDLIYISGLMSNRGSNLYWRFEDATQTMITFGSYTPKVGKEIPIPSNWNRFQLTIKDPNDTDAVYANAVVSYTGYVDTILGLGIDGSGAEAYDQSLNTTDSVKFAGLETDALKVNGLPTSSAGAAIGGIWIDTANGNALKVRTV